jgi:CRISPR-associated protein Cas1
MEPYRVLVDQLVFELDLENEEQGTLSRSTKKTMLTLPTLDTKIDGEKSPQMIAAQRTAASLARYYKGQAKALMLPALL